jgi:hypothetical protein
VRFPDTLPTWLPIVVLAGFSLVLFRVRKRHLRLAPIREPASHEVVILRTSAAVKHWLPPGTWGTKTLGFMELTVGSETVWLATRPEGLGAILGSEWYFVARETRIRRTGLPGDHLGRDWIILQGTSAGEAVQLAVSTPLAPDVVWSALLQAGCSDGA